MSEKMNQIPPEQVEEKGVGEHKPVKIPQWKKDALVGKSTEADFESEKNEIKSQIERLEIEINDRQEELIKLKESLGIEENIEWGANFGEMSWNDAQQKIEKLNKKFKKGEKSWRLPTKDELVAEFKKTNSTPAGFTGGNYWSGTTDPHHSDAAYSVRMRDGFFTGGSQYKNSSGHVRCVR